MRVSGSAVLLFLVLKSADSQLIGFRGVVELPEGEVYRDKETRDASKFVAAFAERYLPRLKVVAAENKLVEQQRNHLRNKEEVAFYSKVGRDPSPVYYHENEIVDFTFSRNMNPIEELRLNKKLDLVEVEKATPPTRLLPVDYYVTTPSTMLSEEFRNNHGPATASPPPPPKPHQIPTCSGSSCAENHIDTDAFEQPRSSRFSDNRPSPISFNSPPSVPFMSSTHSLRSSPPSSNSLRSSPPSASFINLNNNQNQHFTEFTNVLPRPAHSHQYNGQKSYSYTNVF